MKFTLSIVSLFVTIATGFTFAGNELDDAVNAKQGGNDARRLLRASHNHNNADKVIQRRIDDNNYNNVQRRVRGRNSDVSAENNPSNNNNNVGPIACTWRAYFETTDHTEACRSLQNVYSVPYTCDDGFYTNVCCTVSSSTDPTMDTFGACHKVVAVTTENGGSNSSSSNETTEDITSGLPTTDSVSHFRQYQNNYSLQLSTHYIFSFFVF